MKLKAFSIVVAGSMNPAIHHPAWYRSVETISEDDANAAIAGTVIVHPQLAQFGTPRWIINCVPDKWSIQTLGGLDDEEIIDIACKTFERLSETPIVAFSFRAASINAARSSSA